MDLESPLEPTAQGGGEKKVGPAPGRRPVFDPVRLELGEPGEDAEELLLKKYQRRIQRFFAKKGISEEEARDLTQETFLRVYRTGAQLDNRQQLEAWLLEVADNVRSNALRARTALKRTAVVVSLDEPDENGAPRREVASENEQGPEADAIAKEKIALLRQALGELPDQMRRCVLLRVHQDLKYKEIATTMNVSIDTVKTHLHNAKARLRDLLEPHFGPIDF
jgi:RNA polymerase sigma-70 factor (ECF subfamily)